ncbi:HK97 family phage prohead protease [Ancylobacter defluvii]|uniref:Primosomal replication protein N n=1 Tax=Ancylobacter defluvii TaxID=1282440 RepID=A0A9W6NAW4_9HYPH|nr:HK97 family phage prohead protease [Ancylobacter defluvii]MBS7589311.1 HK97 family phage prohead protease [Ancylobacter defluvii]GLK84924.1 primosomal replication protein N [Ancylobacter defluvii]
MIHARVPSAGPAIEVKAGPALAEIEADGRFEGYAALFARVDLGRDLIVRGAFARSLAERGAGGVRMLFQHDPAEPIGIWTELREDATGLFVRGRLMPDVARAREVLALMRAGAIDGLSIGFRAVEGRTDPRSRVRRLTRIDLWEVSIVTFPMQPDARIDAVKRVAACRSPLAATIRRGARRLRALGAIGAPAPSLP